MLATTANEAEFLKKVCYMLTEANAQVEGQTAIEVRQKISNELKSVRKAAIGALTHDKIHNSGIVNKALLDMDTIWKQGIDQHVLKNPESPKEAANQAANDFLGKITKAAEEQDINLGERQSLKLKDEATHLITEIGQITIEDDEDIQRANQYLHISMVQGKRVSIV